MWFLIVGLGVLIAMRASDKIDAASALGYSIESLKVKQNQNGTFNDFKYELGLKLNNATSERISFEWLNIDMNYEDLRIGTAYVKERVLIPANGSHVIKVEGNIRATDIGQVLLKISKAKGKISPVKLLGNIKIGAFKIPVDYDYKVSF